MTAERTSAAVALRRAFMASRSRQVAGWWVGMVAAGMVVVFLLQGLWAWAALCVVVSVVVLWLAGFWVGPRSSDAYLRRVSRAWREWSDEAEWAYNNFSRREAGYLRRIEALRPPRGHGADHERLLALLDDVVRTRDELSIASPDTVHRAVAAVGATGAAIDKLCASATQEQQRRFCDELKQAREQRRAEYRTAAERVEHATEKLLAKLARLRVPDAAASAHAQIVQGFKDYLEAARRFHGACRDEAPDEAARAAIGITQARNNLRSSERALRTSLSYDDRWPSRDRESTGS